MTLTNDSNSSNEPNNISTSYSTLEKKLGEIGFEGIKQKKEALEASLKGKSWLGRFFSFIDKYRLSKVTKQLSKILNSSDIAPLIARVETNLENKIQGLTKNLSREIKDVSPAEQNETSSQAQMESFASAIQEMRQACGLLDKTGKKPSTLIHSIEDLEKGRSIQLERQFQFLVKDFPEETKSPAIDWYRSLVFEKREKMVAYAASITSYFSPEEMSTQESSKNVLEMLKQLALLTQDQAHISINLWNHADRSADVSTKQLLFSKSIANAKRLLFNKLIATVSSFQSNDDLVKLQKLVDRFAAREKQNFGRPINLISCLEHIDGISKASKTLTEEHLQCIELAERALQSRAEATFACAKAISTMPTREERLEFCELISHYKGTSRSDDIFIKNLAKIPRNLRKQVLEALSSVNNNYVSWPLGFFTPNDQNNADDLLDVAKNAKELLSGISDDGMAATIIRGLLLFTPEQRKNSSVRNCLICYAHTRSDPAELFKSLREADTHLKMTIARDAYESKREEYLAHLAAESLKHAAKVVELSRQRLYPEQFTDRTSFANAFIQRIRSIREIASFLDQQKIPDLFIPEETRSNIEKTNSLITIMRLESWTEILALSCQIKHDMRFDYSAALECLLHYPDKYPHELGLCHLRSQSGDVRNYIKARQYLQKAVQQNPLNIDCTLQLASMLLQGQGGPKDLSRAKQLLMEMLPSVPSSSPNWLKITQHLWVIARMEGNREEADTRENAWKKARETSKIQELREVGCEIETMVNNDPDFEEMLINTDASIKAAYEKTIKELANKAKIKPSDILVSLTNGGVCHGMVTEIASQVLLPTDPNTPIEERLISVAKQYGTRSGTTAFALQAIYSGLDSANAFNSIAIQRLLNAQAFSSTDINSTDKKVVQAAQNVMSSPERQSAKTVFEIKGMTVHPPLAELPSRGSDDNAYLSTWYEKAEDGLYEMGIKTRNDSGSHGLLLLKTGGKLFLLDPSVALIRTVKDPVVTIIKYLNSQYSTNKDNHRIQLMKLEPLKTTTPPSFKGEE